MAPHANVLQRRVNPSLTTLLQGSCGAHMLPRFPYDNRPKNDGWLMEAKRLLMRFPRTGALALACAAAVAGCRGEMNATLTDKPTLTFDQITPDQWERLRSEERRVGKECRSR